MPSTEGPRWIPSGRATAVPATALAEEAVATAAGAAAGAAFPAAKAAETSMKKRIRAVSGMRVRICRGPIMELPPGLAPAGGVGQGRARRVMNALEKRRAKSNRGAVTRARSD